jgi:hypothetical protein
MPRIGGMTCPLPSCGGEAVVSKSKGNVLNVKCPRCEFSGYGQAGTRAARIIDKSVILDTDVDPAPPAPPEPTPKPRSKLLIEG